MKLYFSKFIYNDIVGQVVGYNCDQGNDRWCFDSFEGEKNKKKHAKDKRRKVD